MNKLTSVELLAIRSTMAQKTYLYDALASNVNLGFVIADSDSEAIEFIRKLYPLATHGRLDHLTLGPVFSLTD